MKIQKMYRVVAARVRQATPAGAPLAKRVEAAEFLIRMERFVWR